MLIIEGSYVDCGYHPKPLSCSRSLLFRHPSKKVISPVCGNLFI